MKIIQKPDILSFAGNVNDFVIEGVAKSLEFKLSVDEAVIVNEVYVADGGMVRVSMKDVVDCFLSISVPRSDSDYMIQFLAVKKFKAEVENTVIEFTVVKGGISNVAESSAVFLKTQWLTLQPQEKKIMTHQPEYLSYYAVEAGSVRMTVYFSDGSESETLLTLEAGNLYTVDVSYLKISGKFDRVVGCYDVWVENEAGQRLTYVQRYILSQSNTETNVYLFENTLGGIDSVVFTGRFTEKIQTEGTVTTVLEESTDSDIDLNFSCEQNTGFIPSIDYARWLRGFFVSKQRYHVAGALRRIYLRESENGFTKNSLNDFTFEFFYSKQTKYDVVTRNRDELPYLLEFPEVDSLPFLAPRLAEFPIAVVADDLMLPVQYAFENAWRRISVAAIAQAVSKETIDHIDMSSYWKKTELVREGLYLKFLDQFIRVKLADDSDLWEGHQFPDYLNQALRTFDPVQFKSVLSTIFQTIGFSEGIDGFKVDERGNILARSLKLFDFLETPELRYNKITVIGDEFWITTGGVIDEVLPDGTEDNKYTIRLKLEGNNVNTFDEGDICKGIFETELGFQSCYFIVVSSTDEPNFSSGVMDVVLTGYMVAPRRFMNIARIGNVLDEKPERQRSGRVNARNGTVQFYEKVNTWEITVKNMAVHIGECKNAGLPGVDVNMEGNIIWADKMFTRLGVTTFDADGVVIPDIVFVGEWEAGKTYTRNNEVGYMGCVYRCIAGSTTSIPRYDNPDWFMIQGNPNFEMKFTSSNGTRFIGNDIDSEIIATVFKYNQDISDDIPAERWTWTRTSDSPESDVEWNATHIGIGNLLHLTRADFPGDGIRKQTIYCTAFIDAVTSVKEQLKIKI